MQDNRFPLQPGEEVVIRTQPGREWYHIAGNLLVGLSWIAFVVAGGLWWVNLLDRSLDLRSVNPNWIFPLTQLFYLAVIPLFVIAWRVEQFIKIFAVEVVLTDQRILMKSTPHLWSRVNIPLGQISILSPEGMFSGVRFTYHSSESVVYQVPQRDAFIQAFDELTGFNAVPEGERVKF